MINDDHNQGILYLMIKDRKLLFLILATLLISLSSITSYLDIPNLSLQSGLLNGVPYAFAWLILAWILTDKSILRKISPYLIIFFTLLIVRLYWLIFYWTFPPYYYHSAISDAFTLGNPYHITISEGWVNLIENAYYLLIIVEVIVFLSVFIIFWYLSHPRDFRRSKTKWEIIKSKRMIYAILASIFISMPLWLFNLIAYITKGGISEFIILNWEFIDWIAFLFNGLPMALGFVFFAMIITNIRKKIKYAFYLVIFVTVLLPFVTFSNLLSIPYEIFVLMLSSFMIYCISYFLIFLSLLLLSKTKYVE